jgi:hypothetical protein
VEAERFYGLNDIVEWMKYGTDDRLRTNELLRLRDIEAPERPKQPTSAGVVTWTPQPVRAYDCLTLKAVFWDPHKPTALINQKTLAPGEEAKFPINGTNLVVRCLQIQKDGVRVRLGATGEEKTLRLGERN